MRKITFILAAMLVTNLAMAYGVPGKRHKKKSKHPTVNVRNSGSGGGVTENKGRAGVRGGKR